MPTSKQAAVNPRHCRLQRSWPQTRLGVAAALLATAPIEATVSPRRAVSPRILKQRSGWFVTTAGTIVFSAGVAMVSSYTVAEVIPPDAPLATINVPKLETRATLSIPPDLSKFGLDAGDRLKISIYGREDLSTEYRINEDGFIRIPTLGQFEAANQTPAQLEISIRAAADQSQQRQSFVSVDVIEQQPVFVTGLVTKPGAYPISPGMAVVHATTVAGGTISTAAMSTLPTEALREGARLRSSEEELNRLLVRETRLNAEQAGRTSVDLPPRLVERAGQDEAVRLVAREQALYDRQREALERQQASLKIMVQEAKVELEAYTKELANITDQRRVRSASLENVKSLARKGLTTSQRMLDSEILMASIDRDAQEVIANIARSRQSLERAQRDLALLVLERQEQVEKELQAIDEQIVKVEASISGSTNIINQIGQIPAQLLAQNEEPRFAYEVLRKSRTGELVSIQATDGTPLRPGDVVRVSARRD